MVAKMNKYILLLSLFFTVNIFAEDGDTDKKHPHLIMNSGDIKILQQSWSKYPKFADTLQQIKAKVDADLAKPINVPVPKDAGGGFTHEQHKRNYQSLYNLGNLYQILGEEKYAVRATEIFLEYAELYPTLAEHPNKKEQTPGRLFWQSLNEAVSLVYMTQAYDTLIDYIAPEQRKIIENKLLLPMASFLSEGQPKTFNKIHNHGTWAVAAVGMTGYVLDKPLLVAKSLYGLDQSGNSGFLKQLDELFSPDGYYNEGPYYQRYALMPFVLFAKAIANNDPKQKIFEYRDSVLLKAIYATIQLSYNKLFFPINDAIKDKGIDTIELVHGVAIAYAVTGDNALLDIASQQPQVSLNADGFALAKGLANNKAKPFPFKTMAFGDGATGDKGALAILRSSAAAGHQALVVKNTSQGKGHGHFDKLNWLFYDAGNAIIYDYGAARFLNIEQKYGGHYLPENTSWAKQTIAHNTVVVDETSHFKGNYKTAKDYHPTVTLFEEKSNISITSAYTDNPYPGTRLVRTMAQITLPFIEHPLILDVFRIDSNSKHQYDLPVHYNGQIIDTNFEYKANTKNLKPLGNKNGYQHLWITAEGKGNNAISQLTWLTKTRFYTLSMVGSKKQEFYFTRLGANDPNFNLRNESALIQRIKSAKNHTFASILEAHGEYNPVVEYTLNSKSSIKTLQLFEEANLDYLEVTMNDGKNWGVALSYNPSTTAEHSIRVAAKTIKWRGYYKLIIN